MTKSVVVAVLMAFEASETDQLNFILSRDFGRLKIREENILSMKIRANDIDLIDAERFDSFFSVIFNCKIKYCFNKNFFN